MLRWAVGLVQYIMIYIAFWKLALRTPVTMPHCLLHGVYFVFYHGLDFTQWSEYSIDVWLTVGLAVSLVAMYYCTLTEYVLASSCVVCWTCVQVLKCLLLVMLLGVLITGLEQQSLLGLYQSLSLIITRLFSYRSSTLPTLSTPSFCVANQR